MNNFTNLCLKTKFLQKVSELLFQRHSIIKFINFKLIFLNCIVLLISYSIFFIMYFFVFPNFYFFEFEFD